MNIKDWATAIALGISIFNLIFFIWDRKSHLKVGITKEFRTDDNDGESSLIGEMLWVNISNHSIHRIWITQIRAEWSWYLSFSSKRKHIDLIEFRAGDDGDESWRPIAARFWIEPWGDMVLSADADAVEDKLKRIIEADVTEHDPYLREKRLRLGKPKIRYSVAVQDGLGIWHRSKKQVVSLR